MKDELEVRLRCLEIAINRKPPQDYQRTSIHIFNDKPIELVIADARKMAKMVLGGAQQEGSREES